MHTTRLRQAANFPPLKPIEPGRDVPPLKPIEPGRDVPPLKLVEPGREERATRVDTTISRTAHGASTTCAGRFSKPAGFPGNQTGDPPLFDNEVRAPDL